MLIYTVAGAVPAKRKPAIESTYFHGGTFVTSVFRRIENNTGQCKHWHIIIDVEYRSTVRAGSRYTPFGIRGNRQACYARISNSARNQLEFNARYRVVLLDRSYEHLSLSSDTSPSKWWIRFPRNSFRWKLSTVIVVCDTERAKESYVARSSFSFRLKIYSRTVIRCEEYSWKKKNYVIEFYRTRLL